MRIGRLIETTVGALMLLLLMAASYDNSRPVTRQAGNCQEKSQVFGQISCGSLPHRSF